MALSDEEKQQLAALQAKENEPDADDYDIEIWDETGAGARIPYSKGRSWLNRFGIDLPDAPEAEAEGDQDQGKGKPRSKRAAGGAAGPDGHAQRYFGKPKAVS
jgi:hypothetical protein